MFSHSRLPQHVIDYWPEILGEVIVYQLPLIYVQSISVHLVDNTIFDLNLADFKSGEIEWEHLDKALTKCVNKHKKDITGVFFNIKIEQLKTDIKSFTQIFLEKYES